MTCNNILPVNRERDHVKMMFWEGRKAIFSCDHCEKCESTEISQIRFRGDDNPEISYHDAFVPISGKILMRCRKHRLNNYSVETETIYHPNLTEIESRWERRTIQGPAIAEMIISHNPQRDKIIFEEEDMSWTNIR
jgi:hypothetical protein